MEHTKDHKGRGTVGWGTQQHTRFKKSIHGKARHGLAMDVIQDLVDSGLIDLATMKRVPVTTLDRILTDSYVRKQLGDLSDPKQMKKTGAVLKRIALDLTEGLNVNHVREKGQRKTYIDAVIASPTTTHVPPGTRKQSAATATKLTKSKSAKQSWDRRFLIPASVVVTNKSKRIKRVAGELKSIIVEGNENAISMLFRLLLELVLTDYITRYGLRVAKTKHGYDLKAALKAVAAELVLRGLATDKQLHPIIKAQSDKYDFLAVESFHGYVHDEFAFPNRRMLNLAWESYAPLFENILKDK